ncbi:MAG: transposase [Anaerolineae bacterium]
MALAVDATTLADRLVLLVVSVLYRGCAIPVAWQVLPGNVAGAWMPYILALLQRLQAVVPAGKTVLVLADRGLWSPRLWQQILALGWHVLMRVQKDTIFQAQGCPCRRAWQLVPGPGQAWVGRGVAFRDLPRRQVATCVVVWQEAELEPWLLLTDLPPRQVGVLWYGLRVWTELGFRVIKSIGWQWQRTRRLRSERVARHWLVLAVATLYALAYGTRDEDAELASQPPEKLPTAPKEYAPKPDGKPYRRQVSLFRRGLDRACWQLCHSRPWRRLWLLPEPWPLPVPALHIAYHDSS